jgi:hypothetical protein
MVSQYIVLFLAIAGKHDLSCLPVEKSNNVNRLHSAATVFSVAEVG